MSIPHFFTRRIGQFARTPALVLALAATGICSSAGAVTLADQPVFATSDVPGNLALALSVEYPTAISVANLGNYADASEYLGYFNPKTCYTYTLNTAQPANSYFQPSSAATGTNKHTCSGKWSGNFLNWATMQTIDPFRWALSGGYRSVDGDDTTILEKAWGAKQGNVDNFPLRGTDQGSGHKLSVTVSTVTPFNWSKFNTSVWSQGNKLVFTGDDTPGTNIRELPADLSSAMSSRTYGVYVRVKVCDASVASGALLESNCVKYGSTYKPEGLLQQYSNKIRYSVFAYLNAGGNTQQGGVMRAQMSFIGPTKPRPLSTPVTNELAEWSASTGKMLDNPDSASATASGVTQSGVMNYLNKFGQASQSYMTYDNVSELYYAAVRNYMNLPNVSAWTDSVNPPTKNGAATKLDGFPALTTWKDPIAHSCQKNFILGIGDNHTHYDAYVAGGTLARGGSGGSMPDFSDDKVSNAAVYTNRLLEMEGMSNKKDSYFAAGGNNATYYIAGLAYGSHVNDIRPDLKDTQSITTYWMDVMEYQRAEDRNPYWLAAKYGGFTVPGDYDPATTTALTKSWWDTTNNTINMNGTTRDQPDNYFLAGNAAQMVTGLRKAFDSIANAIQAYTTSFSLSAAEVRTSGSASYASQYDSKNWTGLVTASEITFSGSTPTTTLKWSSATVLENQLTGTGWDTARKVVTWNSDTGAGMAFRATNLTGTQQTALTPSGFGTSNTYTHIVNYLRGDRTNEVSSTATGSTHSLRNRGKLLGDVVGAKVTPVGPPAQPFSEKINPGYSKFKTDWASRTTMVYVGANDGMLHAFNGSLTGTDAGKELFAYVPGALFNTAKTDGLVQLANPDYAHKFFVDATPIAFDVDFKRAGGVFATSDTDTNWRTMLIGGLGKGGKSYYAIDVTDPSAMTSESAVAGKVKWEFTDTTMGYSYGVPVVVKTKKYGWVVVLTSGYNNSDGYGYLYFVDPRNGNLLEKVATPTSSHGLTQAAAYVNDFTDYTADAIYVGDLDGQVWRFDVRADKGTADPYPAPALLAQLTDASSNAQPVTAAPVIEIHPVSRKRFVLVGTGQLLSSSDVNSSAQQSFYAIIDGTAAEFNTTGSTVHRSDMQALESVATGVNLTANSGGWYFDLGLSSSIGWRIVLGASTYNGIVAFAPLLTNGDACSPAGQSRVYAVNFGTGKSVLTPSGTDYVAYDSAVTDLRIVSVDGEPKVVVGTTSGKIENPPADLVGGAALRLLNWKELQTIE